MQRQNMAVGEQINSPAGYQQPQQIHQMVQNGMRGNRGLSSSSWLPPPQGSGMRALFLGPPGGKRECAGTGVFLPRHTGAQSEPRKKPGPYSLSSSQISIPLIWKQIHDEPLNQQPSPIGYCFIFGNELKQIMSFFLNPQPVLQSWFPQE